MATIVRTSEMLKEMKPVWKRFIVGLGYSQEQGDKFAEGYAAAVSKLPLVGKLMAMESQYDPCMTAGFEAAGIDEADALKRSRRPAEAAKPKKRPRTKAGPKSQTRRKRR